MRRRPRPGTRHRRLKKRLHMPLRAKRQRRNRAARQARRELTTAMIEMFRGDRRLVPPPWLLMPVVNDPRAAFLVTGIS